MKFIKALILRFGGVLACAALFVALNSAQTACFVWFHQPKVPDAVNDLKGKGFRDVFKRVKN